MPTPHQPQTPSPHPPIPPSTRRPRSHRKPLRAYLAIASLTATLLMGVSLPRGYAQNEPSDPILPEQSTPAPDAPTTSPGLGEGTVIPEGLPAAPVVQPIPSAQYVLEFNRSPVVENRLRLEGIYDEARLWFTRPRNWQPKNVKVLLRYRHSAALYATRSNLNVLVNGTHVGSVPMNLPQGEIGDIVFDVPPELIQDYNELVIAGLQNNSPTCTQDALDPSLWSEILPDSKVVFDTQPQPVALDFSRYPYPIFDNLALNPNQITYLLPSETDSNWLTAIARLQSALGREADYRALETTLANSLADREAGDRLVILGTPAQQPELADLTLPFALANGKFLDGDGKALADDVGILMLATTPDADAPVLVVSGNGPDGVAKAVQFLAQSRDWQAATGHAVLVNEVTPVPSPPARDWPGYLPEANSFQLADLTTPEGQPYEDVTVRGSHSPALVFDFRALPDDQFLPGNSLTLRYSYSPQVNPLTSLVDVQLDGLPLGGQRLDVIDGEVKQSLTVTIPEDKVTPHSKIQVNFRLDPRERRSCSRPTDYQLWGTIHPDTSFDLQREMAVTLPDLELLRTGYPFAAPQDLSTTAVVVPTDPTPTELLLLLEFSERLGRLTKAEAVQLQVYGVEDWSEGEERDRHVVGIGTRDRFPFPEVFDAEGFKLRKLFSRQWQQSTLQTLPDHEGLIKQIISPWQGDRVLLALTAQTEEGLDQVRTLFSQDALFHQLEGDTILISAPPTAADPTNVNAYQVESLQNAPERKHLAASDLPSQLRRVLRTNWLALTGGIIAAALMFYGVMQHYLKQLKRETISAPTGQNMPKKTP
ncbi:MAG: cellulose biosynthesis cyclic di-GMP-binding regulatory protein BcsB [Synechococcales bacterium]|nr:cellulose biosynthesis cyclic di-GMP-binding regulatory protein BcsB [Synechococcales bacterium]